MKVQVEELSPIEKKLSIEVDSPRVDDELSRAYAALGKQVKLPGFRPGKIPRRILEQRFRAQVEDEVIQRVVQAAYLEAIREHDVQVVASPKVTPTGGLTPGQPFAFEARVEVRPKLEVKDYQGLPLKKPEEQVGEEQVAQGLERMREDLSRLDPIADRDVAQAGDFVTVDYEASIDGQPFPGSQASDVTVEVAPGELVESNIAALEGVKVGEPKELDYTFPQDYRVEDVRGKTAHFKLQLKGLKKRVVPELNDDFAKETGQAQSLEELRAKVRSDLEKAQRTRVQNEERQALIKGLLERNPFEVPRAMVDRAIDMMLENQLRSFARMGMDPRQLNLDFNRLREELRETATQEVKGQLLFEAVADKEGIQPTDEQVEKKIEELAAEANQAVATVRKFFQNPDERRGLSLRLREEKTVEFLRARANYS